MAFDPIIHEKFSNAFEYKCFSLVAEAYQVIGELRNNPIRWNENELFHKNCAEKLDCNS